MTKPILLKIKYGCFTDIICTFALENNCKMRKYEEKV